NHRGLHLPVIIGGAAINRSFGRRALFLDTGEPYYPGVFYAKDAFEGLHILDQYMNQDTRDELIERIRAEATVTLQPESPPAPAAPQEPGARSTVATDAPIPTPPFWGHRALQDLDLREVFPLLDLRTLFRLHWGGSKKHGAEFDQLVRDEFEPTLARLEEQVLREGTFDPKIVYGYYPCSSDGNDLIVYDPAVPERELARFHFPRQPDRERLCLADYFRPAGLPDRDVVAFQVVTVGQRVFDVIERLQREDRYADMAYLNGLAFSTTEALAEYAHRRILTELGLPLTQGRRYSWGYPACPDLSDQATLFRVMPVEREIGVTLTESFHLVPEGTTAALVVHHPQAKYFSVRQGGTGDAEP
ncbi:MAG TPA: vitamin B12 dependent-methionine synthase activation domain-containing protein, partial [Dehalococcoidia bacterium]|nr:vitamin B12 dependent-methionine synthase activation domain-containing protein [Dehalococcoidia bacterium]